MSQNHRKTLGILTTGRVNPALVDEFGEYHQLFRKLLGPDRFYYRNYMVLEGEMPAGVDECDSWLVTGSRHGVYENHVWLPPLEAFIRDLEASGHPLIGICFGHQVIAQAMGGQVVKFDGGWGLGVHRYATAENANGIRVLAVHQDQVVRVPPKSQTIMSNDFCANAALSYRLADGSEWARTFQFHPEFSTAWVAALIEALEGKSFDAATAARGRQSLENVHDSDLASQTVGDEIADFLDGVTPPVQVDLRTA